MLTPSIAVEESDQSALGGRGTELMEESEAAILDIVEKIAAVINDVKGHVQMRRFDVHHPSRESAWGHVSG